MVVVVVVVGDAACPGDPDNTLGSPFGTRAEERVRRCLQLVVVDTSKGINEARRRSDVAGVRTHAHTAAQRRQAGGGASRTYDSHVDGDGDSDDDHDHDHAAAADDDDHGGRSVLRTGCVGVFGNYDVGMDTILAALEERVAQKWCCASTAGSSTRRGPTQRLRRPFLP